MRRWFWLLVLMVITGVTELALSGHSESPADSLDISTVGGARVTYQVRGTVAQADLSIQTPGGMMQLVNALVPASDTSYTFSAGDVVYIRAQNNTDSGDLECVIIGSDGTVIAQHSAPGRYGIATCTGKAR